MDTYRSVLVKMQRWSRHGHPSPGTAILQGQTGYDMIRHTAGVTVLEAEEGRGIRDEGKTKTRSVLIGMHG